MKRKLPPYRHTVTIDCSTPVKVGGKYKSKFPPSLNARLHWAQKAKLNKIWRARVFLSISSIERPEEPLEKSHIIFTRHSPGVPRPPDYDNLVTSFKAVQDGLVDAKVIVDDSCIHISAEYCFEKVARGMEKITIQIMEVA